MSADRVLAFGVHPDDVEYGASGTLALLGQQGYEIHIASLAGGEVGHATMKSQDLRERRLAENSRAAELIGGVFHYGHCHDLEVQYDSYHRRQAVRIMREVDPLIVLTLPPMDYLMDHEECSKLVRNAAYIASVPNYDCGVPTKPTTRFPYLYYWNAVRCRDIFGRPLPLHLVIDISSVIDTKTKMIQCHESQFEWLSYHNDWEDFGQVVLADSCETGKLIDVAYAEGFIQHMGSGHPTDNILKSILPELCTELPDRPSVPESRQKFQ